MKIVLLGFGCCATHVKIKESTVFFTCTWGGTAWLVFSMTSTMPMAFHTSSPLLVRKVKDSPFIPARPVRPILAKTPRRSLSWFQTYLSAMGFILTIKCIWFYILFMIFNCPCYFWKNLKIQSILNYFFYSLNFWPFLANFRRILPHGSESA